MGKIKCITFDIDAQKNLPEHIKAKMKANQDAARSKESLVCRCSICVHIADYDFQKDGIMFSVCKKCGIMF